MARAILHKRATSPRSHHATAIQLPPKLHPCAQNDWFRLNSWGFLIHLLKFVWGMLVGAIFLLFFPLILIIGLLFGTHFMNPDEIGLMKVLLVVVGPFAFTFWYIIISRASGSRRAKRLMALPTETGDDYTDEEIGFLQRVGKPRHLRNLGVLVTSFVASVYCAHIFYHGGDQEFFFGVLGGIFSPIILAGAWRLMRGTGR
jgi:hypothetical protein